MSRRFIVGEENNLGVSDVEPRQGTFPGKKRAFASWPMGATLHANWMFGIVRGYLEEFRTTGWSKGGFQSRVFARVLPDSVAPAYDAINEKIAAAEAEVTRLRQERQEILAAAIPNAERVKVSISETVKAKIAP